MVILPPGMSPQFQKHILGRGHRPRACRQGQCKHHNMLHSARISPRPTTRRPMGRSSKSVPIRNKAKVTQSSRKTTSKKGEENRKKNRYASQREHNVFTARKGRGTRCKVIISGCIRCIGNVFYMGI